MHKLHHNKNIKIWIACWITRYGFCFIEYDYSVGHKFIWKRKTMKEDIINDDVIKQESESEPELNI